MATRLGKRNLRFAWPHVVVAAIHLGSRMTCAEPAEDTAANPRQLDPPANVTIDVGMLSANADMNMDWFVREIALFQTANPEVQILTSHISQPQRWSVPIEDIPALPRNIVGINSLAGYEAAYLATRSQILPIERFLPDDDFAFDDFYPALWGPVRFRGYTWAVPLCTKPIVLLCDIEKFKEAGIKSPPRTWGELKEFAARMTRDTNGDGTPEVWGFAIRHRSEFSHIFHSFILQKGKSLFSTTGADFSDPVYLEAAEFVNELATASYTKVLETYWPEPGNFAMLFAEDVYYLTTFANPRAYQIAYVPTDGEDVVASDETIYLAIRPSTPAEESASWKFVKWLTRPDFTIPRQWVGYPCRKDFIEREDYKETLPQLSLGHHLLYENNARMIDIAPANLVGRTKAKDRLKDLLWSAIQGKTTLQQALIQGEHDANEILRPIADPQPVPYALYE